MDQQQTLLQISDILKIAHLQIDVLVKNPEKFSTLEVDLVKDYLKIAYDKLNVLTFLASTETSSENIATPTENVVTNEESQVSSSENLATPTENVATNEETQASSSETATDNDDSTDSAPIQIQDEPSHGEESTIIDEPKVEPSIPNVIWNQPPTSEEIYSTPTEHHDEVQSDLVEETPIETSLPPKMSSLSQEPLIVAETFQEDNNSIVEKLARETEDHTLLSKIAQTPLLDLKKAIGINDRFTFINELFKGNISSYNQFIEELDQFEDGLDAWDFVEKTKPKKNWDSTSSAYKRLFDIIQRKFSI
ncbi:MAG: hypothetical protein PHR53_00025 [Bacteroidales bacterium]|nr:hypothetical protein [Bacteroidales bacterium]